MTRVIRSSGSTVTPADDGRLYSNLTGDGLFIAPTISMLGSNQIRLSSLYGIIQGRDFVVDAQTLRVTLPTEPGTGAIYIRLDTTTENVISVLSVLLPYTFTYDDINMSGTVAEMPIVRYEASSTAVTSVTPVYPLLKKSSEVFTLDHTKWNNSTYTITDTRITEDSLQIIDIPPRGSISDSELATLLAADIMDYEQGDNYLTLYANGGAPATDIPIRITFRGEI